MKRKVRRRNTRKSRDESLFPEISAGILGIDLLNRDVDDHGFLVHAREIASRTSAVVLLSGGDAVSARYSIAAYAPVCRLEAKGTDCMLVFEAEMYRIEMNPLKAIDAFLKSLHVNYVSEITPFCGGLVGYLAYDLKNTIETLPQTVSDDVELPDFWLIMPSHILVHDRMERVLHRIELEFVNGEGLLLNPLPEETPTWTADTEHLASESNFSRSSYADAISRIIDLIAAGDVYQINLSQRFRAPFQGDVFEFWLRLYEHNPASHYAFINGGNHAVLSTSMERFLKMQGTRIESQPIKGTRKRGVTAEEDARLREELLNHPKDAAELAMIVDLMRNDLSRVCDPGTVRVEEHKRIDGYRNVFHLSSVISGTLRASVGYGDILNAAFPAGSVTGCPKIRAMEIIDEIEPVARHVYTGSIGYIGFHANMELSVAIRTATLKEGMMHFSVGGGIVYDSMPDEEYEETLHKGNAFFDVLKVFQTTR